MLVPRMNATSFVTRSARSGVQAPLRSAPSACSNLSIHSRCTFATVRTAVSLSVDTTTALPVTLRLIGDHYHVIPVGHERVSLPFLSTELVYQSEDVAVIFRKKLAEVYRTCRARVLLSDHTGVEELLICLLIQVVAIGNDHKGPVAWILSQHLLREEHHRDRLA